MTLSVLYNYWPNTGSVRWGAGPCGDPILSTWQSPYLAGIGWNLLSLRPPLAVVQHLHFRR